MDERLAQIIMKYIYLGMIADAIRVAFYYEGYHICAIHGLERIR